MRAIPTLDNPMWGQTIRPVETVLDAGDGGGGGGGENLEPLNLYYQPGGTPGSDEDLYRQPLSLSDRPEGDLYLAPA